MRFYRHKNACVTFDPAAHEWLVEAAPRAFFFVFKGSDRPTSMSGLEAFEAVPLGKVPMNVRMLAASRWGGFCSQKAKP
jgi:hypothetical protein